MRRLRQLAIRFNAWRWNREADALLKDIRYHQRAQRLHRDALNFLWDRLTPEQARLLANRLKIAADEAEAMQRRVQRHQRPTQEIPTTTTEHPNEYAPKK